MNNIPAVHTLNRDIPAGKVLIAEPRDIGRDDPRPIETVLNTKTGWGRAQVRLVAVTAGWACAGSAMRWDNGYYAVFWEASGARHGSRYHTFDDALAHFKRIPETEYA